jgi:hypothetical protein
MRECKNERIDITYIFELYVTELTKLRHRVVGYFGRYEELY